jgi:hypothetical protein
MDLLFAEEAHLYVKSAGLMFYGKLNLKSDHEKVWVTVNSHYGCHYRLYVHRFGVLRNTWVFAYESALGAHKRFIDRHRNGVSEGGSMLRHVWRNYYCNFLVPGLQKKRHKKPKLSVGQVVELENCRTVEITLVGIDKFIASTIELCYDDNSNVYYVPGIESQALEEHMYQDIKKLCICVKEDARVIIFDYMNVKY